MVMKREVSFSHDIAAGTLLERPLNNEIEKSLQTNQKLCHEQETFVKRYAAALRKV